MMTRYRDHNYDLLEAPPIFEALEKAKLRDANRRTPEDLKPPEIRNLNDIRRLVNEFDPAQSKDTQTIRLTTTLRGEDEKGNMQTYQVSADTHSKSRRTILLEGFELLQRQTAAKHTINSQAEPISVNGRDMLPPRLSDDNCAIFIDPLIRRWLGAERRGMYICWDLADGFTYRYDILAHKLTRVLRESNDESRKGGV